MDELKADHDKTERRVKSADALAKAFPADREQVRTSVVDGSTTPVLDTATPAGYRKSAATPFAKAVSGALAQPRTDRNGLTTKALVPVASSGSRLRAHRSRACRRRRSPWRRCAGRCR